MTKRDTTTGTATAKTTKTATKAATARSSYSMHPGFAREVAYRKNLEERTAKSLEQWVALTKKHGPATDRERVAWLKERHALGTDYAKWVTAECSGPTGASAYDPDSLVAAMFVGKELLLPLYGRLLELGLALGPDVKASPCATIVPLYRNHVFAQLKPTTKTRLDLGFALGDPAAIRKPGRLLTTGGFEKKDRISHRIPIISAADLDGEIERWLRVAYERDA